MKTPGHFGVRSLRGWFTLLLALAVVPLSASAACTGKLANLQSYAGKYLGQNNLLKAAAIAERLQSLTVDERQHLQRNLDVSGPIKLDACHLVVSGNAPHMGTEQDAMLDVDLESGTVVAAIYGAGRIDIYTLADSVAGASNWNALPKTVREWAVRADMGFPQQPPHSLAQPRSVRLHAPAPATASSNVAPQVTGKPLQINFDKDAIKPNAAQAAAIRRAAGDALTQPLPGHSGEPLYAAALADLNDDGRADLIVQYSYASGYCGSAGCSGIIVMATAQGYARKQIGLPNFTEIAVLPTMHHGMHDLQFEGDSPIWRWTGKIYDIAKADLPQAHAPAWETRDAGDRKVALVVPIDSTIKSISMFCNQGKPVLAMLLKMPRAAEATTLTWVFRGWTVNVPMQPSSHNGTLWMTDLSHSDLPEWLAHRGSNATTSELARLATESFLRINGEMQGQVSLENSTAATRAALNPCYRY